MAPSMSAYSHKRTYQHSGLTPPLSVLAIPMNAGWSQISYSSSLLGLNAFLSRCSMVIAKNRGGGSCVKCQGVMSARSEALGVKFVPPMDLMKRSALVLIDP